MGKIPAGIICLLIVLTANFTIFYIDAPYAQIQEIASGVFAIMFLSGLFACSLVAISSTAESLKSYFSEIGFTTSIIHIGFCLDAIMV